MSLKKVKGNILYAIGIAVFSYILSFFYYSNSLVFYLLFIFGLWILFRKRRTSHLVFFLFFLLLSNTFWTVRAIKWYYLLAFFLIFILYLISFLILFKKNIFSLILFVPLFAIVEFILNTLSIFPPLLISYPLVNIFNINFPLRPYLSSIILAIIILVIPFKRGIIFSIVVILFLNFFPKKINENLFYLHISTPKLYKELNIIETINGMAGFDGTILNEYIFKRDFQKEKGKIKTIFAPYFKENGFLAFGFTKKNGEKHESWAALFSKDDESFTYKHHPIPFLEAHIKKEPINDCIIYKNHTLKLAVCQDILFNDIYKRVKSGDILIVPSMIPERWGKKPRIGMKWGIKYLKKNNIRVYIGDGG